MNSGLALLRAAVAEAERNYKRAKAAVRAATDEASRAAALTEYLRADAALDAAYLAVAAANPEDPK